ncbi:hypothetical protein KDH_41270 [Dictyobacter sp. S3.2.2.5]|uniref:AB hydrolase-1 domain-containing protein n=1 Tax=Dictyobacter halimunensis TaxID=3026934 RepID=A0ABQ6FSP8_9CHLR|nr:hypothetical protein KDH_41270 [Dictyobacter sp. S3.2.2.5]
MFTVYIPDRRGRGLSGPLGANYSIEREDEDLDALLTQTDAHFVFGTADGALFALHAAISLPAIQKVIAYEPVLFAGQPGLEPFIASIQHFELNMAKGGPILAVVGLTKDQVKALRLVPDSFLIPLTRLILRLVDRNVKGDDVPYRELLPTLRDELQIVTQTEGTIENYRGVTADVLLLLGSKSAEFIKGSINALHNVLPHVQLIELHGLNHDAAQDYGKPGPIAQEIKRFIQDAAKVSI